MILNGSDILVFINDGVDDIAVACQRGVSVEISDNVIDTTCKQDEGYMAVIGGKREFKITCDALVNFDDDGGTIYTIGDLFAAVDNRTKLSINISNPLFTSYYFVLEAYCDSIDVNAPMEDVVSYSASFTATGEVVSLVS